MATVGRGFQIALHLANPRAELGRTLFLGVHQGLSKQNQPIDPLRPTSGELD